MFNYQTDRALRDEVHVNTMESRGFTRPVRQTNRVRVPKETQQPDPLRPWVWSAAFLLCLAAWGIAAYFARDIVNAAIGVGDMLGWTAR